MHFRIHKLALLAVVLILLSGALQGCSSTYASAEGLKLMPMDQMPAEVQTAPSVVQASYQFAAANPDVMQGIPCYCGCGRLGHSSNYSCYVQSIEPGGKITWDDHALGCSLCVDITQDAMRLLKEGQTVPQIKAYVDTTYSRYGTSNMP